MKVSIVIPAYNEEKYIGKTLESMKKLDKANCELEVLVIDGSSTDQTAEVAQSHGAQVKREPHKSIGFARQHGLKHTNGEVVVFTDADTIVPTDWLKKYIQAFSDPDVVCAYGTYRVDSGSFPYYQITNFLQPPTVMFVYHILGIYLAGGQNMGVRRGKALEIGGFDEKLALLEDADMIKRMGRIGKVAFLADNIVISSGRRSNEGWRYFLRAGWADVEFFLFGKRKFKKFPDYR